MTTKKKKVGKELLRFFITALGGLVLWFYLFFLLDVDYSDTKLTYDTNMNGLGIGLGIKF